MKQASNFSCSRAHTLCTERKFAKQQCCIQTIFWKTKPRNTSNVWYTESSLTPVKKDISLYEVVFCSASRTHLHISGTGCCIFFEGEKLELSQQKDIKTLWQCSPLFSHFMLTWLIFCDRSLVYFDCVLVFFFFRGHQLSVVLAKVDLIFGDRSVHIGDIKWLWQTRPKRP